MSGSIKESEDVSKAIEKILELNPRLGVEQTEEYKMGKLTGHVLVIKTYLKDMETGEKEQIFEHKHKIPKNVPTWITKNNLWYHTQGELQMLHQLTKQKQERRPSNETLEEWRKLLEFEKKKKQRDVLPTNNDTKQAQNSME